MGLLAFSSLLHRSEFHNETRFPTNVALCCFPRDCVQRVCRNVLYIMICHDCFVHALSQAFCSLPLSNTLNYTSKQVMMQALLDHDTISPYSRGISFYKTLTSFVAQYICCAPSHWSSTILLGTQWRRHSVDLLPRDEKPLDPHTYASTVHTQTPHELVIHSKPRPPSLPVLSTTLKHLNRPYPPSPFPFTKTSNQQTHPQPLLTHPTP